MTDIALLLFLGACSGNAAGPALELIAAQRSEHQGAERPEAAPEKLSSPPIILITIDTLRRDHLGCYGYFRDTSPNVDAFAREAILFERALVTMASTYPSHLSMLTGLYPHQHGRTSNQDAVKRPFASGPGCTSVARALQEAGWRTAAFVSSRVLVEQSGISDGFQDYWCPRPAENPAQAAQTTDRALAWLDGVEREKPFFLWVHLWDTHEPNLPPEPYASMFATDERLTSWIEQRGIDPAALEEKFARDPIVPKRFLSAEREADKSMAQRYEERQGRRKSKQERPRFPIDAAAIAGLFNRYDGCVRYVDDQVGRVFERLKALGLWDEALVVFTADHGQSLGEDTFLGHGRISNVNTFVPLLVRVPHGAAGSPRRDSRLVSLVDLVPTLLGRLEDGVLGDFRAQLEGSDVLALGFDRPYALVEEATQFHGSKGKELKYALIEGRWKYVRAPEGNQLYDLEAEGEGVDVLQQNQRQANRLHAKVEELLKRRPEISTGAVASPQEIQELLDELEDLGYAEDE